MKFIPPNLKTGEFAICDIIVNGIIHFKMVTDGNQESILKRIEKKKIKNPNLVKVDPLIVWKKAKR